MKLTKLLPLFAVMILAACSKEPVNDPENPNAPAISLNNRPSTGKPDVTVRISASVDPGNGTVPAGGVKLTWNDGTDHTETMEYVSATNEYTGAFTPTKEGTVKYYASVTNSNGHTAKTPATTFAVSKDAVVVGPDATKLRLSEIGTYDGAKFIEIFNPTEEKITLENIEIFKNGEPMQTFTATKFIGSGNYGVLFAKGTAQATGMYQNLGQTEVGLSGTKSLLIELKYKDGGIYTTIDAFSNTRNPDIARAEWDDEPETAAGRNFFRKDSNAGLVDGWFWTASSSTPGGANTDAGAGTQLKHQYFKKDAVADVPYIRNLLINPGSTVPKGITAGSSNTISVEAYTDLYSDISSVKISVGSSATDMTEAAYGFTYTGSPAFSGSSAKITIVATNGKGASNELAADVTVFSSGTTFAEQKYVMINEIDAENDYIELYNSSSQPVALVGMYLRKNKNKFFTIPSHMVLKAGGYAILGCKDNNYSGANPDLYLGTVSTGLSGKKSLLIDLRDADKNDLDLFSNVYAASGKTPDRYAAWDMAGASYIEREFTIVGRHPSASLTNTGWYMLNKATLGTSNSAATKGTQMKNQVPKLNGAD